VPRRSARPVKDPVVSQAIVRAQTLEEREYERWQVGIADRRRRVGRMRAELDALKRALARFETVCHARVGDLLIELRRLRQAITDHERRLRRLGDGPAPDPDWDEVFDAGPDPSSWWSNGATEATTWEDVARQIEEFVPRRTAKTEAEVKRLYIDLAKRCHPDYGRTDEECQRRAALMLRVNAAFRDRDLATLRAIAREAEGTDPTFEDRPPREKLAWARQEVAWLDAELEGLRIDLVELRGSEVHRRWRRHEAGEPVLERLEDDLQARLTADGRRLDELIAAFREAQAEHRRSAGTAAR